MSSRIKRDALHPSKGTPGISDLEREKMRRIRRKGEKPKPKADRIQEENALIGGLRAEGYGWCLIARYLQEYKDLKVTPSYLRKTYLEINPEEAEKEDREATESIAS